ncbi:MAG: NUDIX domain-containing protein [Gammaproteobacteria bacterium]|nr:NUDIX domain-containing protein [Gammaproteobacteria bacterium]
MGAGVIPLTVYQGEVLFLFQKTFTGRKVGHLIDFGGGLGDGEDYRSTAVREFVEETETMYLADDLKVARRSEERIRQQIKDVDELFEQTLTAHPHWWRRRQTDNPEKPKDWRTYFIEFPWRDISALNSEWESDTSGRFKKRRELVWVEGERLLDIYMHTPDLLWKRVRQLEQAQPLIHDIRTSLLTD